MPMRRSDYDPNWKDISDAIRLRAKDRCEECGVENGALIHRFESDLERYITAMEYKRLLPSHQALYRSQPIRVVLTCAHLDNDTTNNEPSNLKALCQLHHLRLDAAYHAQNAKKTRAVKEQVKRENAGQMRLFSVDESVWL